MERSMAWKVACNEGAIGQNDMKEFDVDGVTVLLARVGEEYFAYPRSARIRRSRCARDSATAS